MTALSRSGIGNRAIVHRSDLSLRNRQEHYQAKDQSLTITRAAVWARLLFTPISPCFPFLLNRSIKTYRPDVLHLHMPNVSVFWLLFSPRARRIPWVVHWQSDVIPSNHSLGLRFFYALYRPFERAILKHSTAIICSSPPYQASSVTLSDFLPRCHTIPLGLEPWGTTATTIKQDSRSSPLRLLAVGRLTYYKGFEYLIRAIAQTSNVELRLVGEGDQGEKLRSLAKELGLDAKVRFLGHISDEALRQEYSACDCLCLPSIERTEAFGLVLLEAMSHGKATIISDVPGSGMGWIVDDGVTGLHVPPQDVEKLTLAIHDLERDRGKMLAMGKNGQQKFRQKFHIDMSASSVSALYTKVLANSSDHQSRESL